MAAQQYQPLFRCIGRGAFQLPPVYRHRYAQRCRLHTTPPSPATPLPITASGPPPDPPLPATTHHADRIARRKKQAEMLQRGKAIRADENGRGRVLNKRFWKDVIIKEVPDGYQIFLDTRPVRTPSKSILRVPSTKPHLAAAIATEWDLLVSAQQALKQHFIPLTSLAARAEDIRTEDIKGQGKTRTEIIDIMMRYLDTDTMLCWAPDTTSSQVLEQTQDSDGKKREGLRDIQARTAEPIIAYLKTHIWPGVDIHPVRDSNTIVPPSQPQTTKAVIRGWLSGLPAYELAALERAVLAGKGLLAAVRLIVEWSPEFGHLREGADASGAGRFGIDEAAEVASLEVRWQTGVWGEVEDTHDVEREDLRRQLGSAILLVSDVEL